LPFVAVSLLDVIRIKWRNTRMLPSWSSAMVVPFTVWILRSGTLHKPGSPMGTNPITQIISSKSAESKSSKVTRTFHTSGIYYKRFSSDLKDLTQKIILASDGWVNLSYSSGRKAVPCGKIGVHPHTPLITTTPTSLAFPLDRWLNAEWKSSRLACKVERAHKQNIRSWTR
jgi:hypothetical protein